MSRSHRLKVFRSFQKRKRRVVLPKGNQVSIRKKGFFTEKNLGKNLPILNISEGGMQVLLRGEVNVGDKVHLYLDLKELDTTSPVVGKIKWLKPVLRGIYYRAGIEFTKVPEEVRQKLKEITEDPLVIEYEGEGE